MKKLSVTFLVVLMCAVFVFSGCSKASKATAEQVYTLYTNIAEQYNGVNKPRLFDGVKLDLSSENAYPANVYSAINTLNEEGDELDKKIAAFCAVNMLKADAEYDTMLKAASCFYTNRSIDASFKEIPQNLVAQIYEQVDSLTADLDYLAKQKSVFETSLFNFESEYKTSIIVRAACEDYFEAYLSVIKKMYEINQTAEEIYTNYVLDVVSSTTTRLLTGELQRLVLSSAVYFAEYHYLKHCVLNNDLINCFSYDYITNKSNQIIENANYDETFAKLQKIVSEISNISDPENLNDPDALTYYNYGIIKLQTLKHKMKAYREAVQKVLDFKKSHPNQEITAESDAYYYNMYLENMDAEVYNFESYLILNIIG